MWVVSQLTWGVLLWPAKEITKGKHTYFEFGEATRDEVTIQPIVCLKDWSARPFDVLSPIGLFAALGKQASAITSGIVALATGKTCKLKALFGNSAEQRPREQIEILVVVAITIVCWIPNIFEVFSNVCGFRGGRKV